MSTDNHDTFDRDWDNQLHPTIHDDGKGMSVCFHVSDPKADTEIALHFDVFWPEPGLPSYDSGALKALIEQTYQNLGHIVWPEKFPSYDQLVEQQELPIEFDLEDK